MYNIEVGLEHFVTTMQLLASRLPFPFLSLPLLSLPLLSLLFPLSFFPPFLASLSILLSPSIAPLFSSLPPPSLYSSPHSLPPQTGVLNAQFKCGSRVMFMCIQRSVLFVGLSSAVVIAIDLEVRIGSL